jgi:16S rRNA (adenine1518-N6/adenine1519-N6)-dimethyltransferase
MAIDLLPPIRDIIKTYDLQARKSLGQNFLFDLNLTAKIVRYAGDISQGTVIEVGPGPGALTRALVASNAKEIIAIDPDTRCLNALDEYLLPSANHRLHLKEGDALALDLHTLGTTPRKIIANLPYNIATVLLFQWLEHIDAFDGFTLMFQKEVADRIVATPRSKHYGRLAVMTQSICHTMKCFVIPPSAFYPPP